MFDKQNYFFGVAMNKTILPGAQPLAVHEGDGVTGVSLLDEGHKTVTLGLQGLGITDHPAITAKKFKL